MGIAIVTGASSGLGREYALALKKLRPDIQEYWLIARRKERLEALGKALGLPYRALDMDLTQRESLERLDALLAQEQPQVICLVNNSGFGRLGDFIDMPLKDVGGMVRLNCQALTEVASAVLPYIPKGGVMINVCSIAAFVPNARMAVYCSTKAYVLSLSKALRYELKDRGVNVLAVCPAPMDTEFLEVAGITGHSKTFDRLPRVNPRQVAEKSIAAAFKGCAVYTNRLFYKFYRVLAKLLPSSWLMPLAKC